MSIQEKAAFVVHKLRQIVSPMLGREWLVDHAKELTTLCLGPEQTNLAVIELVEKHLQHSLWM